MGVEDVGDGAGDGAECVVEVGACCSGVVGGAVEGFFFEEADAGGGVSGEGGEGGGEGEGAGDGGGLGGC